MKHSERNRRERRAAKGTDRNAKGFTLLEVLISILMVSLIMTATYAVLFTTLDARDRIEKENLESKIGPSILNLIEQDVSGAWTWNIHKNDVFMGERRVISGERADFFHLITTTNSTYTVPQGDNQVRSDLTEVSYVLRQNPRNPDLLELWRRQDFHVDEEIAEGGLYELIYSRVKSFQVTYFADLYERAEEIEEWETKKRGRLPAAMDVRLVIEIDPTMVGYPLDEMARELIEYRRVFFFPQGSELTMAVRPVIPTFEDTAALDPEQGGDEGGGGGGGDNQGGSGRFGGDMGGGDMGDMGGGGGPGSGNRPPFDPPPEYFNDPKDPPDDIDLEELLKLFGGRK